MVGGSSVTSVRLRCQCLTRPFLPFPSDLASILILIDFQMLACKHPDFHQHICRPPDGVFLPERVRPVIPIL